MCFNGNFLQIALSLAMLPWHASVSLVFGMLFAASLGKMSGKEPDGLAAGLDELERNLESREGRSDSSFQFTFDVGCQEDVSTLA